MAGYDGTITLNKDATPDEIHDFFGFIQEAIQKLEYFPSGYRAGRVHQKDYDSTYKQPRDYSGPKMRIGVNEEEFEVDAIALQITSLQRMWVKFTFNDTESKMRGLHVVFRCNVNPQYPASIESFAAFPESGFERILYMDFLNEPVNRQVSMYAQGEDPVEDFYLDIPSSGRLVKSARKGTSAYAQLLSWAQQVHAERAKW